jgi:hypothetical protein
MVHASQPSRHRLAGGGASHRSPVAPLTAVGLDKTGESRLSNWTIQFLQFQAGDFISCSFHVATHFGDSTVVSTISSMSSMKGGNSRHNKSDLKKSNILKPTFDTLMEEGHKVFKAYRTNVEELFLLRCEVT